MWSALHVLGLAIFIKGLLLTRVHLPDRSPLVGPLPECPSRPAYDRLVMVVVDALRYDMVIADGRYLCEPDVLCHQGHMPFLTSLATNASGHEVRCRLGRVRASAAARGGQVYRRRVRLLRACMAPFGSTRGMQQAAL